MLGGTQPAHGREHRAGDQTFSISSDVRTCTNRAVGRSPRCGPRPIPAHSPGGHVGPQGCDASHSVRPAFTQCSLRTRHSLQGRRMCTYEKIAEPWSLLSRRLPNSSLSLPFDSPMTAQHPNADARKSPVPVFVISRRCALNSERGQGGARGMISNVPPGIDSK